MLKHTFPGIKFSVRKDHYSTYNVEWTTALEKARTRVKNRIEELQLAIDKKEKINKQKNVQNYNDTELDHLS